MAEINARTLMFNLGREDAIDSTTSAKIARYAERKQLAYKLTDKGVLLLDGRGKKIHLRNGVVTLRNALGLHALAERIVSRCRAIDPVGDNRILNKQQQHTNVVTPPTMLHVRKMALVDPRLLKSLRENPTPLSPLPDPTSNAIDTTLRDLDAEMTSILDRSDADESEKKKLFKKKKLYSTPNRQMYKLQYFTYRIYNLSNYVRTYIDIMCINIHRRYKKMININNVLWGR